MTVGYLRAYMVLCWHAQGNGFSIVVTVMCGCVVFTCRELLERLEDIVRSGDPDLLVDLRALNGSKESKVFDSFWDIAERMVDAKFKPRVTIVLGEGNKRQPPLPVA